MLKNFTYLDSNLLQDYQIIKERLIKLIIAAIIGNIADIIIVA